MKRVLLVAVLVSETAGASPLIEVGAGVARLGASRGGGEGDTKSAGGPLLDAVVLWPRTPSTSVGLRLTAMTGIEDEQHAHDHFMLGPVVRVGDTRLWFDLGAGLAMYRGRYRYLSFWSADDAYDFDFPSGGLFGGAGVVVGRGEGWALDVHLDVALTFGGEVSRVSVIGLGVGGQFTP